MCIGNHHLNFKKQKFKNQTAILNLEKLSQILPDFPEKYIGKKRMILCSRQIQKICRKRATDGEKQTPTNSTKQKFVVIKDFSKNIILIYIFIIQKTSKKVQAKKFGHL